MDARTAELRDLFADKQALEEKRKQIKEKALTHRDDVAGAKHAKSEIEEIDRQLREVDEKIKKIQKEGEEKRQMDNKLLHFDEKMERADVLNTVEYRSAFFKKLQGKELTEDEQRSITSATSSGGAAIPTMTMDSIIGQLKETAPMLSLVTVLNIPELISLPKENVVNDASWVAEDADSTNSDDSLTNITLSAYKLIRTVKVTAHLQAMAVSAFEEWVVNTITKKMRAALDKAVFAGTGNVGNQPTGLDGQSWDSNNSVEVASSATISYDTLVDVEALVDEDYINNAVWVMNRKTLAQIMKIKDDNKRPVFERAIEDGFRGYIIGIPVKLDKNVQDGEAYLGDFAAGYVMNFSKPIELASSKEAGFMSGATVYRGLALVDGKPTGVKGAIAKIKKGA